TPACMASTPHPPAAPPASVAPGIRLGVANVSAALAVLRHPEATYPIVHVAGTNGKGSVCAYVDSCLRAARLRTGRVVSPFLVEPRDAVMVDGAPIATGAWDGALRDAADAAAASYVVLTQFELWTVAALTAFRDAAVDIAVIEVGVGGRTD